MNYLGLESGVNTFVFHGPGVEYPVVGCMRRPMAEGAKGAGLCREQIQLVLRCTAAGARALAAELQSWAERVRISPMCYLRYQLENGGEMYRSRMYALDFDWIAGSRQAQGAGVQVTITRDDFWEGWTLSLPLSNRYGTDVSGGIRVDNRADGNGENQVSWAAGKVQGELPVPAQIYIRHDLDAGKSFDNFHLGMYSGIAATIPAIEGESASTEVTLSTHLDTACNGGYYGKAAWTGQGPFKLFSWALSNAFAGSLSGLAVRPFVRFPGGYTAESDLWVYWVLSQEGVIHQSEAYRLQTTVQLQPLPLITLPASWIGYDSLVPVNAALYGRSAAGGGHELRIDAVYLLGAGGARHLQALPGASLNHGRVLVDNGRETPPFILNESDNRIQRTFHAYGSGLVLHPQQAQSVQVVSSGNNLAPTTAKYRLELRYAPRVRLLP